MTWHSESYDWFGLLYDHVYCALVDYVKEAEFVLGLAKKYAGTAPYTVLDLGCGTGSHLSEFARRGCWVIGVDRSPVVLEQARLKLSSGGRFLLQDFSALDMGDEVDLAISMFSSMGYLLTDEELISALGRVRGRMRKPGCLVLELWQRSSFVGPLKGEVKAPFRRGHLERQSELSSTGDGLVNAKFVFRIVGPDEDPETEFEEDHKIRMFSQDEVKKLLSKADFETLAVLRGGSLEMIARKDERAEPEDLRMIIVARPC